MLWTIFVILLAALISPAFKPCILSGFISVLAFPLWIIAGILGEGTEC